MRSTDLEPTEPVRALSRATAMILPSRMARRALRQVRRHAPSLSRYPGDRYLEQVFRTVHGRAGPLADPPPGSGLQPTWGEPGPPVIGKTLMFMRYGPALSLEHYERFGPVSWTTIFGMKVCTVIGPEAAQHVLVNRDKAFSQQGWEWFIGPFFNRGLMLLDGEEHHDHRRIMQEAFTRPRLEAYARQFGSIIEDEVPQWPTGRPVRIYPLIKGLSLRIATEIFMGIEQTARSRRIAHAFEGCVRAGLAVVRFPVPGLRWERGLRSRKVLEDYFRARIPAKRASDDQDLFAALCHVETDEGHSFSDEDVVNHMIFLMMAAHDTSTTAATAVCWFLARHPEWQERCREESLRHGYGPMDLAGTEKLEALDLVFMEALRLVTPVPGMARRTTQDTEICGHYVPAGTMVTVGAWASHLLPHIWAAAESFDPTRLDEPRREDKQHRFAHMAFGGGVHKCIGMAFGRAEVKALIHRTLLHYRIEMPADYEITWDMTSLPNPADGFPVTLKPLDTGPSTATEGPR
jgi:cytochrome P450